LIVVKQPDLFSTPPALPEPKQRAWSGDDVLPLDYGVGLDIPALLDPELDAWFTGDARWWNRTDLG
jgi:hypothetical protein